MALDRGARRAERGLGRHTGRCPPGVHPRLLAGRHERHIGDPLPLCADGLHLGLGLRRQVELAKLRPELLPVGAERPGGQHQVGVVVARVAAPIWAVHRPGAHRVVALREIPGELLGDHEARLVVELVREPQLHVAQQPRVAAPLRRLNRPRERVQILAERRGPRAHDTVAGDVVVPRAPAVVVHLARA